MPIAATDKGFLEQARALAPELVRMRRQIHSHPELSFSERETAAMVAQILEKHGYQPKLIADRTGVIAEIGDKNRPLVAVRADMDALPIEEMNSAEYCSKNNGVMHACGHDAHTACALGAAIMLAGMRDRLDARIRFIFQPAEESVNEAGLSGASLVIRDGALQDVTSAVGLHVFPELPTGCVAVKSGPLLAACSTFKIVIKGAGTHGAMPELGVDAVVVASHVIQAIQTIVSRRKSALDPVVITLGGIKSSTYRSNIVAEEVELIGTIRYFNSELIDSLKAEIVRCCSIAEAMGGSYVFEHSIDNPVLFNDPWATDRVRAAAARIVDAERVLEAPMIMGAEDFSFISAAVPSCFVALGAEIPGDTRKFHTSTFDIDETALPFGAALLCEAAIELSQSQKQ